MGCHRIIFLAYDGFELLDMAGPAGVFSTAAALDEAVRYDVRTMTVAGGAIRTSCGTTVLTEAFDPLDLACTDTVIALGAYDAALRRAMAAPDMRAALRAAALQCGRIASVCTGAFLLARAGLLDGYRATTHWSACAALGTAFPAISLEPDALYVEDRNRWTSAGVTAGIDMALAMIARDHGEQLRGMVARQLVVYAHRPGHQSQFSEMLATQTRAADRFAELVLWIGDRLDRPPSIGEMAVQAGMSERNFLRRFKAETGEPPSAMLARLRLERARLSLEAGLSIKETAARVGFRSEAAFRSMFAARLNLTPSHYARLHRSGETRV